MLRNYIISNLQRIKMFMKKYLIVISMVVLTACDSNEEKSEDKADQA